MNRIILAYGVLAIIGCAASTSAKHAEPAQEITVGNVVITPLGKGVYAAIRSEPLGLAVNSNSLFIVNDDHVVVVDAQFTRMATQENIAALRRITRKPVRYVVNTHWHDDHLAGNQVYRDSFPGVRFISQINTRTDLVEKGRPNRAQTVQFAPSAAARYERLLKQGLGGDSTPASEAERRSLTSAIRIIRQYVDESSDFRELLADTVVDRSMTLTGGGRTIELRWFGRANTRGDLVVWLPAERVVATGDIVVAPIPFAFSSYPTEWIAVLDSVKALAPLAIVPGHGPLMRDSTYMNTVQRMLRLAREETMAAAGSGVSADSIVSVVRLGDLREAVAGQDKWMNAMFEMFFHRPVVTRVYEELKQGPLK